GRQARAGGAAHADHDGGHGAQGPGPAARHRRPVRRDQGAIARLLRRRLREPRGGDRVRARPLARQSGRSLRDPSGPALSAGKSGFVSDTELGWIDAALTSARPQAVGALLRYFRDLDIAEEAFQDACLRALTHWPQHGPPRDPAAWLIFVGRN